jgi:hypothetical protein
MTELRLCEKRSDKVIQKEASHCEPAVLMKQSNKTF